MEIIEQTQQIQKVYTISREDLREKFNIKEEIFCLALNGKSLEVHTKWTSK